MEITTDEVRQQRASARLFADGHLPNLSLTEPPRGSYLSTVLSQGGALRAYPELLTAEPRRGSLMTDSFRNFHRPNLPEVRTLSIVLSQGGALRAYPELLTAEPRRGSLLTDFFRIFY